MMKPMPDSPNSADSPRSPNSASYPKSPDSPDSPESLVFECDFDEPPEKVWRALTEPRLIEAWLATDESPRTDSGGEQAGRSTYEIMTAEPNRRVRYRWRDREGGVGDSSGREVHSVVTVELVPCTTGGTHLRLTHGEFRIVAMAPSMIAAARVRPITSARRPRAPIPSLAVRAAWRRAA